MLSRMARRVTFTGWIAGCVLATAWAQTPTLGSTQDSSARECNAKTLPLEDIIRIGNRNIDLYGSEKIALPALPEKPGKALILRFRAVSYAERKAGGNWTVAAYLNEYPLGRHTTAGRERLIGRPPAFRFAKYGSPEKLWPVFSGPQMWGMFAPDVDTGDTMNDVGLGATYALDISDVARGVDGNTLKIVNTRAKAVRQEADLIVQDIEIGWLDRSLLPPIPDRVPRREEMADKVSIDGLSLLQGTAGGFSVRAAEDLELLVETAIGMDRDTASDLIADDKGSESRSIEVKIARLGPNGYRMTADWAGLALVRTLEIADGLIYWKERWTNTGDGIRGLPFRHRFFLRGESARIAIAGITDANNLAAVAQNPTLFLGSDSREGNGLGVTLESDWLRLISRMDWGGGVGEVYTEDLALPPGGSIDFALTITPVLDGGGYWTLINSVRERWGMNGATVERPFFWNWGGRRPPNTADDVTSAFGNIGPVAFTAWNIRHPWIRMGYDIQALLDDRYPKLTPAAPRTPGKTPDLDVDAWLTGAHQELYWQRDAANAALVHEALPGALLIGQIEMAHDPVYMPAVDRWPCAEDMIIMANGQPFEDGFYNRAYLGDWSGKDWKMIWHAPRPGSCYLERNLRDMRRAMDEFGMDGLYVDEFTFAGFQRGYTRYDYSRWDGYSADLDADGNVVRLKSDNAFSSESAQVQIIQQIRERGKFFLANGGPALRSVNNLRAMHFIEGGNGQGSWPRTHLTAVPLVMGNFGVRTTLKGYFDTAKLLAEYGCVYSPSGASNLEMRKAGPDNFISKLYPITIRRLGAGVIEGAERLITTRSGQYAWPASGGTIRLYSYDNEGLLINRDNLKIIKIDDGNVIEITVPQDGLAIAEIMEVETP